MMKRFLHTVGTFSVLFLALLATAGCSRRNDVEEMVKREVQAISEMRQLGLVEYRVRKIVKANDEGEWYKIGDRKILLSCTAYLKAGLDLSSFSMEDVDIDREAGSVTVTVRRDAKSCTLLVEDTGIGIPEADRPNIFERFYRVDKARSRASGGSGLGLSIVHDAVKLYGGTVEVDAVQPHGSRFTVIFPRANAGEEGTDHAES
jgi:DNA topoisomerase VI subunit B